MRTPQTLLLTWPPTGQNYYRVNVFEEVLPIRSQVIRFQEENIVIYINATDNLRGPLRCNVISEVTLFIGINVSIEVRSDYFIKDSHWNQTHSEHPHFHQLPNSKFSITYEMNISSNKEKTNNFTYKYSHTQKVVEANSGGTWNFTFQLLRNYDPWKSNNRHKNVETWFCQTHVQILEKKQKSVASGPQTSDDAKSIPVSKEDWLLILVSLFGILLLLQTSVIIVGKVRRRKSKKNNDEDPMSPKSPKTKRGAKPRRNIADRPPLPLPDDVVKEEKFKMEPKPSPMSPEPKRHHFFPPASAPPMAVENPYNNHNSGPLVPKQSYRNKGLDNSDEDIRSPGFPRRCKEDLVPKQTYRNKQFDRSHEDLRSPGFPRRQMEGPYRNKALDSHEELRSPGFPRRQEGPLVPKQSQRNKPLKNSEEELRTPGFARRQMEAKLAQLPPKAVTASKSCKVPKPLPRLPSSPKPEKAPAFHPAHRKEPAPPLHPKNMPVFPPAAPCRIPESRLSDVDWQYEELQPASKYLNTFSDTPYDNM